MRTLLRKLASEDAGQDVVEYALLAAVVALAGAAALGAIEVSLGNAFTGWATATQGCWKMPEPGAGGGC
jgi:Flp pilus assembly pilin Flp